MTDPVYYEATCSIENCSVDALSDKGVVVRLLSFDQWIDFGDKRIYRSVSRDKATAALKAKIQSHINIYQCHLDTL